MEIKKRIEKISNGTYIELYHKKGDISFWHREDGPAYIEYNEDGSIKYEYYYVDGRLLYKEEWESEYGWKSKLKNTPMGEIYCK